jgi:prevent-host-death family protein
LLEKNRKKIKKNSLRFENELTKRTFLRTFAERSPIMTTLTASEARASLYRLIDQAAESHKPVLISGKRANAVLVSEEDWSAIQETLYLLSVPGMRESIKDSMAEPLAKSKRTLKW